MKSYPKISIVTPSYNQASFLEACIDSILSQNYPNLEYIILDGGSDDGSVEIIKKYEKYLHFWRSEKDHGQYHAIQTGLNMSSGEIMGWLNSDDKLHIKGLFTLAEVFSFYPDIEFVTGKRRSFNEDGSIHFADLNIPQRFWRELLIDYDAPEKHRLFVMQEGTYWRRSLWEKAGSYISTEYKLAADYELWLRFMRYVPLYSLNAQTGGFRSHSQGQRSTLFFKDYIAETKQIIDKEKIQFVTGSWNESPMPVINFPLESELKSNQRIDYLEVKFSVTRKTTALKPFLSIIIVHHEKSFYTHKAIESVLNQDGLELIELIVIDITKSRELEDHKCLFDCYLNKPEHTIAKAYEFGIVEAKGEIVNLLLSDDELVQNAFQSILKVFNTRKDVEMLSGLPFAINEQSDFIWILSRIPIYSRDRYIFTDYKLPRLHISSVFIRKSVIEKSSSFNLYDPKIECAFDINFIRYFLRKASIVSSSFLLAGKREFPDSWLELLKNRYEYEASQIIEEEVSLFRSGKETLLVNPPSPVFN